MVCIYIKKKLRVTAEPYDIIEIPKDVENFFKMFSKNVRTIVLASIINPGLHFTADTFLVVSMLKEFSRHVQGWGGGAKGA